MSLVFRAIPTEGIAEISYLIGDDEEGVAAVFDPRADCDVYIDLAREAGVAITHIFETHIHADLVTARHTPGHTPEHMSYLLAETDHPDEPWAVLTGDSLFVSSAGRPDLLGEKFTRQLAEQQFHSLRDSYLELADHVIIYRNTRAGLPCGADTGARLPSTIG